jgi:hypothetical protein
MNGLICERHRFVQRLFAPTVLATVFTKAECWHLFQFHFSPKISSKHEAYQHFVCTSAHFIYELSGLRVCESNNI